MRKIDQSADVTLFIEDRGWLGAGLATLACVGCGVIFYIVWAVDAQMGGALRAAIGLACGIGAFIFIRLVLRTETRREMLMASSAAILTQGVGSSAGVAGLFCRHKVTVARRPCR